MNAPRVFISYSHDSPEHDKKVLGLANRLREDGIDCMIDQSESAPVSGWPCWMEYRIREADFVLMVCTETYLRRVHDREEPNKGLGVCREADIIYNYLYDSEYKNPKFIPIVLSDTWDKIYTWILLQGYTHYEVFRPEEYVELFWRLTDKSKISELRLREKSLQPLTPLQCKSNFFPLIHNLPYAENPFFCGRDEILAEIHKNFTASESHRVTQAITGPGGVGKTQIALAYAYQYAASYQVIWWVRAENPATLDSDCYELARAMGFKENIAKRYQIICFAKEWLLYNTGWLLIYDNVSDYHSLDDYQPFFRKGHILITTRNNQFEEIKKLSVDVFSSETSAQFLKLRAELQDEDGTLELARELGGFPLALELAAAYMAANHINCRGYLELYDKYHSHLFSGDKPPVGYHDRVLIALNITLERIAGQAARQLLYLAAFLNPSRIHTQIFLDGISVLPQPLAEAIGDELYFNRILTQLETYSLIQRRENDTWTISGLLQEVIREFLGEMKRDWADNIVKLAVKISDFDDFEMNIWEKMREKVFPWIQFHIQVMAPLLTTNYQPWWLLNIWEKIREIIPHVISIIQTTVSLQTNDFLSLQLCNQIGNYYHYQGGYDEAEPFYKWALAIRERVLGSEHPDTVNSLYNLARIYENHDKFAQAVPLYKQALEIRERVMGPEHPDTASSIHNLADIYFCMHQYTEAESFYKQALKIRKKVLGLAHPDTASSLNNMACLYNKQERYVEAESLFKQAWEIRERVLEPNHPDRSISLVKLADFFEHQHRYEEAELFYKLTLESWERILGPSHSELAILLDHLAGFYKRRSRYAEAEIFYRRALEIREWVYGMIHPLTAYSLRDLACLYEEQSRYEEAQSFYYRETKILLLTLRIGNCVTNLSLSRYLGFLKSRNKKRKLKA